MQLNLFEWANNQRQLTDMGGRCPYCLEESNWLELSREYDKHKTEYFVEFECQTVLSHEDGSFHGLCKATKEKIVQVSYD